MANIWIQRFVNLKSHYEIVVLSTSKNTHVTKSQTGLWYCTHTFDDWADVHKSVLFVWIWAESSLSNDTLQIISIWLRCQNDGWFKWFLPFFSRKTLKIGWLIEAILLFQSIGKNKFMHNESENSWNKENKTQMQFVFR